MEKNASAKYSSCVELAWAGWKTYHVSMLWYSHLRGMRIADTQSGGCIAPLAKKRMATSVFAQPGPDPRVSCIPEIPFCEAKHELLANFSQAVGELTALHGRKARAVMSGEQSVMALDRAIERAREKKERAKNAYVLHVGQHRCGCNTVTEGAPENTRPLLAA